MELLVFGHGGKPLIVFPSSGGKFYEYEDFGMISAVSPFIEEGKLQVFCIDSKDRESWFSCAHPADKARRANDYDWAVIHDVIPFIERYNGSGAGITAHGCSFGAYHSMNFLLRHPDVFDSAIALSGNYSIRFAVGDFNNEDVYFNDPLSYLPNLEDWWFIDWLREDLIIMCAGQGPWEDWNDEARALSRHLWDKGIPHLLDFWGFDVAHDWPWWKIQMGHFLGRLDAAGLLTKGARIGRSDVARFLGP
jgi:esterase/lipase superfamily enzyme